MNKSLILYSLNSSGCVCVPSCDRCTCLVRPCFLWKSCCRTNTTDCTWLSGNRQTWHTLPCPLQNDSYHSLDLWFSCVKFTWCHCGSGQRRTSGWATSPSSPGRSRKSASRGLPLHDYREETLLMEGWVSRRSGLRSELISWWIDC